MKSCQTELECGHLYYFRLNHCAVRSISQTMATENLGFYEADVFMDTEVLQREAVHVDHSTNL